MAVTEVGAVIAVWVTCGVLIVAIAVVLAILYCRRRRAARKRYLAPCAAGAEEEGRRYYPGYERLSEADVCTEPQPGWYTSPRVVFIHRRPSEGRGRAANAPGDILVNIDYLDPSTTSVVEPQNGLVPTDGYPSTFLLYTAPLEFLAPGTYVVQAYTVYEALKAVGPLHQFVFRVSPPSNAGGADPYHAPWSDPQGALGSASEGTKSRHHLNDVVVNIASTRDPSAHANAAPQFPDANAPSTAANRSVNRSPPVGAGTVPPPPPPPRITPAGGTITTHTPIVVSPNENSTTADQIRYSIDGSYPTVMYTGPFKLSIPPESVLPSQKLTVKVKAIAVSGSAVSDVAEAMVKVQHAGYSFFDPDIPAPSMRLRAVDATLYFDESNNPPGARTAYQLLYVNEVRRRKAKFSRRKCRLYERQPIPISENVALVYAWTVDERQWNVEQPRPPTQARGSARAHANDFGLVESDDDDDDDALYPHRHGSALRSVATVYDCQRAAAEHAKPSRKRTEALRGTPGLQLLPPPVICVSCAEMEVEFEDAPANSVIAYTLNDTEPALYDVVPPACAVPVISAATSSALRGSRRTDEGQHGAHAASGRHGKARAGGLCGSSSSSSDDANEGEKRKKKLSVAVGDDGGLATYRYQSGQHIKVTLLETEGVYVTARTFMPIFEDAGGEGTTVGALGGQGGSAGQLVGYRFGKVFRRGFFFAE